MHGAQSNPNIFTCIQPKISTHTWQLVPLATVGSRWGWPTVSYLQRNQRRVHGPERVAQGQGDGTPTPQATLHSYEVGAENCHRKVKQCLGVEGWSISNGNREELKYSKGGFGAQISSLNSASLSCTLGLVFVSTAYLVAK